jgi:nicotinate-nucleotide pyrophosphorylase (carboxylating)
MEPQIEPRALSDLVGRFLAEDIGRGDITTQAVVPPAKHGSAHISLLEPAVIAGLAVARQCFEALSQDVQWEPLVRDATPAQPGVVVRLRGPLHALLTAERTALNLLGRLSGIATVTARYVAAVAGTPVRIVDTRKTTPGLRALEKAAVRAGGGANHRFGLFDMVLVKDNHLLATAGFSRFTATIQRIRAEQPQLRIEVEADSLEQVRAFLEIDGIDVILLDNMNPAEMREAVALGKKKGVKFEASGGVTLKNIRQIAASGVDYVSVGAITHSA